MKDKGCSAVVATTRKHMAKEAGADLGINLKSQLDGDPDFIVLFFYDSLYEKRWLF